MLKIAVILAGGKGTRFWPLSRSEMPKQLIDFLGEALINKTITRLKRTVREQNILILTTRNLFAPTKKVTKFAGENIITEPEGRNTAPAIAFLTYMLYEKYGDCIVGFFPADQLISPVETFSAQLSQAFNFAEKMDRILIFGIKPTAPNINYGYIHCSKEIESSVFNVERFMEKPNIDTARQYVGSNEYFWNAGIFVFKASVMLREYERYSPQIFEKLDLIYSAYKSGDTERLSSLYSVLPDTSVDYAIMQKTENIALMKADFDWSDVGTFSSVYEVLRKDENENTGADGIISLNSSDNLILSKKKIKVLIDVNDIIFVESDDALLIMRKGSDYKIKKVVEMFRKDPELKEFL